MWCVASAPIVPLARDLDAALGLPQIGRAAHFRTRPTPSQAAPAFLHKVSNSAPHSPTPLSDGTRVSSARCPATFSSPFSISSRPRISSTRCPRRSDSLRTCLRAFPHLRHVPPRSTPLPPHGHRCNGTFLPKTQKNEHRSLGSGARFGLLSGRHSAEWG